MSLENEINQLYSCNINGKTLIEQAQHYLKADDKMEKSLRDAFINCAAAYRSDRKILFNYQPIVLLLVELAARLCQIKPDDQEYLQQLSAYLTLSLTEYSTHLDHRLISRALFKRVTSHSAAMDSSKQLSINISPVTKATPSSNSNLHSATNNSLQQSSQQFVTQNAVQPTVVTSSNSQAVVKSSVQQVVAQPSVQQNVARQSSQQFITKNSIQQNIVKNSSQQGAALPSSQQLSTKSSMQQATVQTFATQQSVQHSPAKSSTQKLAISISPPKKPIETWAVTDSLSLKKKPTLH